MTMMTTTMKTTTMMTTMMMTTTMKKIDIYRRIMPRITLHGASTLTRVHGYSRLCKVSCHVLTTRHR